MSALQIWLGAFTPLHILCLRTFFPKYKDLLRDPYRFLVEGMDVVIFPTLNGIAKRLRLEAVEPAPPTKS